MRSCLIVAPDNNYVQIERLEKIDYTEEPFLLGKQQQLQIN